MDLRRQDRPIVVDRTRSPEDVYIGRGSPYGNPFRMRGEADRDHVVGQFRDWLAEQPDVLELASAELPGKRLGCYCAPRPCHGDVLAEAITGWPIQESVMVFDSNLAGRHMQGAALSALKWYGAKKGIGEGMHEASYALPTKDGRLCILPIDGIGHHVEVFLSFALRLKARRFIVSRLGTGLAGYEDRDIAPLFEKAPDNVEIPARWRQILGDPQMCLLITGSRQVKDRERFFAALDDQLSSVQVPVQIITGSSRGADALAEAYAVERGLLLRRIPVNRPRFGDTAKLERNWRLLVAATHVLLAGDLDRPFLEPLRNAAIAQGIRLLTYSPDGRVDLAAG